MQPEASDRGNAPPDFPLPAELEYSLDQDDWVDFYACSWSRLPRPRLSVRLGVAALVVPAVLTLPVLGILVGLPLLSHGAKILRDPDLGPFFGMIALVCLGFVLVVGGVIVLHARSKKQTRKVLRRQAEALVRHCLLDGTIRLPEQRHVRMTEEGFVETCEFRDTDGGVEVHARTEFRVPWGGRGGGRGERAARPAARRQ